MILKLKLLLNHILSEICTITLMPTEEPHAQGVDLQFRVLILTVSNPNCSAVHSDGVAGFISVEVGDFRLRSEVGVRDSDEHVIDSDGHVRVEAHRGAL